MELNGITAASTRDQFMNLLVTQLRNQDPLDPVKQENFTQQLAQFATLEGVEGLNSRFDELLSLQELTQSANLIGKTATYTNDETGADQSAQVDEVRLVDGKVIIVAGGQEVSINSLIGVKGQ
jgi:flagellar basal-body rod modification protein FlgD